MKSLMTIFALLLVTVAGAAPATEPAFDFPYADGLYATITLRKRLGKPAPVFDQIVSLPGIPGFKGVMNVRVLWQTDSAGRIQTAPLIVSLPGLMGHSDDQLARRWQSIAFDAGGHVLSIDSPFSPEFNRISGQGVAGNLAAEARAVAGIIQAFLEIPGARDHITEAQLLGASYGGSVALYLARLSRDGRLPFRLGPVVAFSPPVSMQSTAQILDSYYERDFGAYHFDLLKLVRLRDRSIAGPGSPSPFEPRLMRAGIGYLFHKAIKRAVETNDAQYCLGLLDWYKRTGHRRSDPGEWTFIRFVEEMSWPYWRQQGVSQSLEEYWTMGDLAPLLPVVGDDVFVYLSIDDPLDDPGDVIRLQKKFKPPLFNVLPYGGHLGYATSEWVRKIVLYRLGSPPCLCNVPAPALARSLGSSH